MRRIRNYGAGEYWSSSTGSVTYCKMDVRDRRLLLRVAKALEASVQARDHFLRIQFSGAKSDVRSAHDAVLRAHADEERALAALNKRSTKP